MFFINIFLSLLISQNISVDVDKYEIYEGESINYTITVKNGQEPIIDINNIKDFRVISGPNSSTQMQWINGKMSSSYSLSWQLMPISTGNLKIPSFNIKFDNSYKKTSEISITVLDRKQNKRKSNVEQQYFIEASVDNISPYRGEQIVLTYSLYTKVNLSSFDFSDMPTFKGFWSQETFSPRNLQFEKTQINREVWYKSIVKKIALFPTKSGKQAIEPATISIGVKTKNNSRSFNFFGDDFFSRSKQVTLGTNEIVVDVKKLPPNKGNPSAAVGNWKINTYIDNKNIKQDEAFTFIIDIEGVGNIKSIQPSQIDFPNSLEIFDPEINIIDNDSKNKLGGKKNIEYVIIPRDFGNIDLPEIKLTYFDVRVKKWVTKNTKSIKLNVEKNDKTMQSSIGLSKEEVLLVGQDIRYLNNNQPKLVVKDQSLFGSKFYTFIILSLFFFLFPKFLNKRNSLYQSSKVALQSKNALKIAIKSIDKLKFIESKEIYSELYLIINNYFAHKTNNFIERTSKEIIDLCNENDMNKEVVITLSDYLSHLDTIRYSSVKNLNVEKDISAIKEILYKMDGIWV